jgi:hypothetical protein
MSRTTVDKETEQEHIIITEAEANILINSLKHSEARVCLEDPYEVIRLRIILEKALENIERHRVEKNPPRNKTPLEKFKEMFDSLTFDAIAPAGSSAYPFNGPEEPVFDLNTGESILVLPWNRRQDVKVYCRQHPLELHYTFAGNTFRVITDGELVGRYALRALENQRCSVN